jgi:hypothetical protein
MRNPRAHARAQAQAKAQALSQSWDLALWSVGTLFSAVVLYLVWVI